MFEDSTLPPLRLRLFGPFEVQVHGSPLPHLRSRKHLALLALLALRDGRDVQRAWVAGTLWPESTEAAALSSLRQGLLDARRALGVEGYRLSSPTHRTLVLDLTNASVDVMDFTAAIGRATPPDLEAAVALFRGPLLEGWSDEWVLQDREQYEQQYLDALETVAEDSLAQGDLSKAIGYLHRITVADPLRESAHSRLMQALADQGDFAALVQAYRELRLLLHRELNSTPSAETTSLYLRLRSTGRSAPRALASSRPPMALSDLNNLPPALTSFIGREKEIEEVKEMLARTRLLTLTGSGGCGKTRLSLEVARCALEDYDDGVWFVELAALSDPTLVPQTVASALSVAEKPGELLTTTLVTALAARRMLLILDNCEHLLDAAARLVDTFLKSCPGMRILISSREALGTAGENTYRVPSLSLPPQVSRTLAFDRVAQAELTFENLFRFEAVRLFIDRAIAIKSDFTVLPQNASALIAVCHRLDGIPLAIELAAARVRALPVEEINTRLDNCFRLLTGGNRTALPRQQTLRALIDWSYDLLNLEEKTLLARLSAFAGGWTLEAVEAVCQDASNLTTEETEGHRGTGAPQYPIPNTQHLSDVLDLLTSLVDKSLVLYEERAGKGRFRLLETVRQYARERLLELDETAATRKRHCSYFVEFAERAEPNLTGTKQAEWLERLEEEHDNLRAALDWCVSAGAGTPESLKVEKEAVDSPTEAGLRLAGAVWRFWHIRGYLGEGRRWLTALLTHPNDGIAGAARAKALDGAGALACNQGDYAAARALHEEGLALYRGLNNRPGVASALNNLAGVAMNEGDYLNAKTLFEESLCLRRELGDRRGIAVTLGNLGLVAREQGDASSARLLHEQGLAIFREIGNRRGVAVALGNLGNVSRDLGDRAVAQASYEEALAICRELGDRQQMAPCLLDLGIVAAEIGDHATAANRLSESLRMFWDQGNQPGIVDALSYLAPIIAALTTPDGAVRIWGVIERISETIGAPRAPFDRLRIEREISGARAALSDADAFDRAWQEGRAMTIEQAIQFALEAFE
jgi:non-specific serine/threonine protein kinase